LNIDQARAIYWTIALILMGIAVIHAATGIRQVRRGETEKHRRSMGRALIWVAVFLVSYLGKVLVLGHENLELWSADRRLVINLHRGLVLTMLVTGGIGRLLAGRALARVSPGRQLHRVLGWIAFPSAIAGLGTAVLVLAQMWMALPAR
jgi:uncharacterized membrane protein YozB (DUF420 family)